MASFIHERGGVASFLERSTPNSTVWPMALLWGNHAINKHPTIQEESRYTPSRFMLAIGNQDELSPDKPLGSHADLTFTRSFVQRRQFVNVKPKQKQNHFVVN